MYAIYTYVFTRTHTYMHTYTIPQFQVLNPQVPRASAPTQSRALDVQAAHEFPPNAAPQHTTFQKFLCETALYLNPAYDTYNPPPLRLPCLIVGGLTVSNG